MSISWATGGINSMENMELTAVQKALLNEVQAGLPVASQPFKVLGDKFGMKEVEVIETLAKFKEAGYIRRVGAIFDSRNLGYVSTLCATKVAPEQLDEVAEFINQYIEVTHNYLREHEYNLWFTVIAPSQEKLAGIIREIEERFQITVLNLPATKFFKIRVSFDFKEGGRN